VARIPALRVATDAQTGGDEGRGQRIAAMGGNGPSVNL
jgi:hypothetical protein